MYSAQVRSRLSVKLLEGEGAGMGVEDVSEESSEMKPENEDEVEAGARVYVGILETRCDHHSSLSCSIQECGLGMETGAR